MEEGQQLQLHIQACSCAVLECSHTKLSTCKLHKIHCVTGQCVCVASTSSLALSSCMIGWGVMAPVDIVQGSI